MTKINKNEYPLYDNDNAQQEVFEFFEERDKLQQAAQELDFLIRHENGKKEE